MDCIVRKAVVPGCVLGCALAALTITAQAQQQAPADQQGQSQNQSQYEGQSHPPDDAITTAPPDPVYQAQPIPKPSPSHPMTQQPAPNQVPNQATDQPLNPAQAAVPAGQGSAVNPIVNGADPNAGMSAAPNAGQNASYANAGTDDGIVQVAPQQQQPQQPALMTRDESSDPDGGIVHPAMLPPGTLEEGTQIQVRLMTELSSTRSEKGDDFRGRVAADVIQDGQVLIPAGSEITGKVVEASGGHFAGHGTLRLRPETVILPNGSQYMLVARVSNTWDSPTRVNREGTIEAGTRYKRDGVEYGGGVGAGVVTGAVLGGPVGALAGGIVGASLITVHLMLDHPQVTLDPGTTLLFTLSSRLSLVAPNSTGN